MTSFVCVRILQNLGRQNTYCFVVVAANVFMARFAIHVMNLLNKRTTWLLIIIISSLLQASSAFLTTRSARVIDQRRRMPMMVETRLFAEEKKEDGVLYWETGDSGVQLPVFKTRPKMIVFDKDVRTL